MEGRLGAGLGQGAQPTHLGVGRHGSSSEVAPLSLLHSIELVAGELRAPWVA